MKRICTKITFEINHFKILAQFDVFQTLPYETVNLFRNFHDSVWLESNTVDIIVEKPM